MSDELDMTLPFGGADKHKHREDAQRPVERLVMTDFSDADIANAKSLASIGAEQDPDSPRAFWHYGHCFYVHPTEGVIEL